MNVAVRNLPLLVFGFFGLLLVQPSHAQTSVATVPVGYVQQSLAPSLDGTTRAFSVVSSPLQPAPVWVGLVASVSGNTITLSGSIPAGLSGTNPYLVHVETAANTLATGQSFLITAAGTNSVTVSSTATQIQSLLASNDQVAIRAAVTLGSIFGTSDSSVQLETGSVYQQADVVYIWNGSAFIDYFFEPGYWWVQDGDPNYVNQNNLVIYPDEAVMVARISQNTLPSTYAACQGTVPSNTQTASNISAPGFTLISNPLPVRFPYRSWELRTILPGKQALRLHRRM